jgi:hypothetical protein
LVYPVVGHSFLPADRVFGRIEKRIKLIESILTPQEYHGVFAEQGTVIQLGKDCPCQDWKSVAKDVFKPPKDFHFKLSEVKRVSLRRQEGSVAIRGEPFYRSNICGFASIVKRGKTIRAQKIPELIVGCPVSTLKARDVDSLLQKHFGDWRNRPELAFYAPILERTVDAEDRIEGGYGVEKPSIRV